MDEIARINEQQYCNYCFRVPDDDDDGGIGGDDDCMEEVERVITEFYDKGEFAFGSFWGRQRDAIFSTDKDRNDSSSHCNRNDNEEQEDDERNFVRYKMIQRHASFTYTELNCSVFLSCAI